MELQVGKTYKSPIFGRYIKVLAIDPHDATPTSELMLSLDVIWIDPYYDRQEYDYLFIPKSETKQWTEIQNV